MDPDWFKALERFALDKVYRLAERLFEGDIRADPICKGEGRNAKIPCSYCDYWEYAETPVPKILEGSLKTMCRSLKLSLK